MTYTNATEERHYEAALNEATSEPRRKGLWAKALALCEGDQKRAEHCYVKLRVEQRIAEEQQTKRDRKYQGVGGWLLLFCVMLTILSPIVTLARMFSEPADATPALTGAIYVDRFLVLILLLCGIEVGVRLWSGRPAAARAARQYLGTVLVMGFVRCIVFFFNLPPDLSPGHLTAYATGVLTVIGGPHLLFFGIWYPYFSVSKRVRATFPDTKTQMRGGFHGEFTWFATAICYTVLGFFALMLVGLLIGLLRACPESKWS